MPKGWRTLSGPRPTYREEFHLVESHSRDYAPRTFVNAGSAHATIRIAHDFTSAGERCTLRAIAAAGTPHFDIGLDDAMKPTDGRIEACVAWLRELGTFLVINVAGNSEQTSPGIEAAAEEIVGQILDGGACP